MISEAVSRYNDLLSEKHLNSSVEILQSADQKLAVAGRPVCSVLRPYLIEKATYSRIQEASVRIMRGIGTLCRRMMEDENLRRKMDFSDAEEAILQVDSGYGFPDVSARLDGFLSSDGVFQFVEYNPDSPGGIGYGDVLSELFASMPVMQEFSKHYPYEVVPVRSHVFDSLLRAYQRWGGKGLPAIGIIDWNGTPTYPEFLLFQEVFEKHGCRVKIGDPRDLEYRNGRLYLGDFAIELVYKRLVVGEMLERLGTENPLVRAARDRAVCVANGFGVQLAFKKTLFALLSDPAQSDFFEEDIRAAIRTHIPWTRCVQEQKTEQNGKIVDLIPHIAKNKDSLVLKPGGEYGGKGVLLGWETDQQNWESSIAYAMQNSYVVQERVGVGKEIYPSLDNGKLIFTERYYDLDPYVWNGQDVHGCGVRLSRVALLNVSAGGGSATPMFILRP